MLARRTDNNNIQNSNSQVFYFTSLPFTYNSLVKEITALKTLKGSVSLLWNVKYAKFKKGQFFGNTLYMPGKVYTYIFFEI